MPGLTTFSIRSVVSKKALVFSMLATLILLTGCSLELPSDTEEGTELSLASRIERAASAPRASFNARTNQITVRGVGVTGLGGASSALANSNAGTGQFIGAANIADDDDDDDDRVARLVLNANTSVPCSVTVQVDGRLVSIPVRNAPASCTGAAVNGALNTTLAISKAKWKASSNKLTIKGDGAVPRQLVSVFDAITGQLLGTDQSNAVGKFKVKVRSLFTAPCFVSVVSSGHTIQSPVTNSPLNCAAIPNIPGTVGGNSAFNQAPDGAIIGPIADMAISIGSSVNFTGTGFDPDSNVALSYRWDFDFVNPNDQAGYSSLQNPTVNFNQAGVYRVSLRVMDSLGLADPTPDTRVIVVQPNVGASAPPSGVIVSPANNIEINAGGFVNFSGAGTDVDGTVTGYIWNFAGGAQNSSLQNPGNVMFATPGVFLVSLSVIDSSGLVDPTPQFVAVTVRGGNTGTPGLPGNSPTNQAPNGEVTNPTTNVTISTGASLNFTATAFDPDNNSPLRYNWSFGGGAVVSSQASTSLNPGAVTFSQPGVYTVMFTATDALGRSDLSPSVRVITVTNSGTGNGNNIAPESAIVSPTTNTTITVGQSVNFMGSGNDFDNNSPLSYIWNFGGAAINSTQQNPGAIVFNQPGTYNVSLAVRDSLGATDATPAMRIITVLPGNNVPGSGTGGTVVNFPPESFINTPATNVVITAGQEVDFSGTGSDPENNSPLIYKWMFDGAAPDNMVQNPGKMVFNRPGSYRVRLMVKDSMGNVDPTPAERMITVNDTFTNNLEPVGTITMPTNSSNITVGQSVNFASFGTDSDGSVMSYQWDFGGAALDSQLQNPGLVVFNKEGLYKIMLYVKDNMGFYDSTPDVRFVTVTNSTNANQAPNAKIIGPATDIMINMGDSVMFSGAGEDADNFGNSLVYSWNFGGAAANTSQAVPGLVRFNQAGTYTVSLSVMDNFGASDLTPAVRTVTVADSSASNTTPFITMTTAGLRPNVNVGESLNFFATATDSTPGQISYFWNFDGAAADSNLQNPGLIMFNRTGVYKISVYARDALNKRSNVAVYSVTVGTPSLGAAPDGIIVTPTNNVSIMLGETMNFMGSATNAGTQNAMLNYRWNFDGVAASSSAQNPGNVTFDKVGVFNVSLTVADSLGATDIAPAIRTITVRAHSSSTLPGTGAGNGGGFGNQAPNGSISSPFAMVTNVAVGSPVNFSASAVDVDNNVPISYRWSFGAGMADSFVQNPGAIVFNNPGTYSVSLTVTDSLGMVDFTPDVRTIVVGGFGGNVGGTLGNTGAPNSIIDTPSSAVTITRGQSVYFSGSATDPNFDTALTYRWDFGGAAVNSTQKTPGNVVFSTTGVFVVSLTVTDSTGLSDLTPMVRRVTVLP